MPPRLNLLPTAITACQSQAFLPYSSLLRQSTASQQCTASRSPSSLSRSHDRAIRALSTKRDLLLRQRGGAVLAHRPCVSSSQRRMESSSSKAGAGIGEGKAGRIADEKIEAVKGSESEAAKEGLGSILKRDKDALKNAPKVLRDQLSSSSSSSSSGSRSFSTSARSRQVDMNQISSAGENDALIAAATEQKPVYKNAHEAWKIECSAEANGCNPPQPAFRPSANIDPSRPLLPGPPSPQLPLNPILYLTLVVDSVAPLLRIKQQPGAAGGGRSLPIPLPLALRQRRRTAIKWIIDASEKRKDAALANRVAQEIIAVAEGKSSVWDKRGVVHKQGTASRANIKALGMKGRKKF
ncbi:30S ribosomal protein S7 [Histoplasma capsulatum H143]|uniref:30S ribosomal protein S7 n=1 Tax=Ajellomyces capsulatus (strain H143) TaxID=544712 RepID=C6HE69_AJECH|nr:30S ribosomal protein S7 [Histoplasma capsulatum H143]